MQKLLLLAVFVCSTLLNIHASDKTGILYMKTPANYEVKNLSRNGQWACGTKYDYEKECSYGFRWNLLTNNIEMLGGVCQANCIADDGTVAGSYYTNEGISSGKTIEVPAIWKDGSWQVLQLPNELGSWAASITPDGKYVTGADNNYNAYIWTDGKITTTFKVKTGGCNMPYVISPDGQKIGGWSYSHDANLRNVGYWVKGDDNFHELEPNMDGSPWQAVKRFSKDSNKILFWGGYHEDAEGNWGLHAIYDIATKDTTMIYPIDPDPFNIDFYDMNGDATIVTGYEENGDGEQYGFVWHDGETELVEPYLEARGANFDDFDLMSASVQNYSLIGVPGVDAEAKTFAILYYDNSYNYHTMVVAFDRDMSMTPPNNLKAVQVAGLTTVELSWEEPLGDKSTLKGYNIYRNGEKITTEPVTETTYFDKNLQCATYDYKITAQYEEGETAGCTEASVTIVLSKINAPTSLAARQKGYNSGLVMWDAPESNLPSLNYYGDESTALDGFGGASVSFESGTLFPEETMKLYEGYSVAGVTFFPATEQESWIVNLYTHKDGQLTSLYSYTVDQDLKYGEKNTVKFPEPQKLEAGQDLLVGVQTNVNNSSYDVQKVYEDCLKIGYTDLIRQVGESDFYSINTASGSEDWNVTWATGVLLSNESTPADIDVIDHYTLYLNDSELTTTGDDSYIEKALANGNYTVAVDAVFKDGSRSEKTTTNFAIKADTGKLPAITPDVTASGNTFNATWNAPLDSDPSTLAYCGTNLASVSPMTNEDVTAFAARVDFLPTELRTYGGYQIKSLDFYPCSEASFDLQIYEDGTQVSDVQPDALDLGMWNTIPLDEPITIDPSKTYSYIIYCYDCPVDESPLGIDTEDIVDNASYLMVDGAEEWSTIEYESYLTGNWLMRMNVETPDADQLNVKSYDVYYDDTKVSNQQSLTYSQSVDDTKGIHVVRVDANYSVSTSPIIGEEVWFQFIDPSGIEDLTPALSQGEEAMYNVLGQRVNKNAKGILIQKGKKFFQK